VTSACLFFWPFFHALNLFQYSHAKQCRLKIRLGEKQMQMTLAQLRDWVLSQDGIAEVIAVRAPGLADSQTPNIPPDQTTGTYSGDEQRWARIITTDGTNPDAAGPVEVEVKTWLGTTISDWMSPDAVSAWLQTVA
jgi:hypothetical protein